ncbi:hypothetical protein [Streptomyces sp. NPDC056105]|uniref:hypothetical protein n=1 Tax=Streptomyces sp. NPDC056105 TaxID=3345714 RepID=UPI0035DAC9B0
MASRAGWLRAATLRRLTRPGVFSCSTATPPGPGAQGMCGAGAATSALRHLGIGQAV